MQWYAGKQVDAWVKFAYQRPRKDAESKQVRSADVFFVEFDCAKRALNWQSWKMYDAAGRVLRTDDYSILPKEWRPAVGVFGLVLARACALTLSLDGRWREAGITDKYLAFYDTATVTRSPSGTVQFWTRQQYKQPELEKTASGKVTYVHTLVLFEIDCPRQQWRMLRFSAYSKAGEAVRVDDYTRFAEFEPIAPESSADRYRALVCQ